MKKYTKTSGKNDEIVNVAFTGSFSFVDVLTRTFCVELCSELVFV